MKAGRKTLNFRIVGRKLPGLKYGRSKGALVDREPVYLGVQRRAEAVDLVPGDAREAVFDLPVDVVPGPGGRVDFRGPFVHGPKGKRFLYLSWGELGEDGSFTMFRRAKLPLSSLEPRELLSPSAGSVELGLDLTDEGGGPLCGTVAGSAAAWRVRSHGSGETDN